MKGMSAGTSTYMGRGNGEYSRPTLAEHQRTLPPQCRHPPYHRATTTDLTIMPLIRVLRVTRVFRLIPRAKGLRTLLLTLVWCVCCRGWLCQGWGRSCLHLRTQISARSPAHA